MHTCLLTVNKGFLVGLPVSLVSSAASPLAAAAPVLHSLHAYAALLAHAACQRCGPCLLVSRSSILWQCSCRAYCRVLIAAGTWAGPMQQRVSACSCTWFALSLSTQLSC